MAVSLLAATGEVLANPYASGVNIVGSNVTFYLNEAADNVTVSLNNGSDLNLGALGAGQQSFGLGTATGFDIKVRDLSAAGYRTPSGVNLATKLQTSVDTNLNLKFFAPRGVAVMTDPASPQFGRIYVANSNGGATASPARTVGDGLFLLNPDLSEAIPGQGDTGLTAGLDFSATAAPYRIHLGKDGLYIADWSDATGSVYRTDFSVSDGSGVNVLTGAGGPFPITTARTHGSIAALVTTGSVGGGDLKVFTVDEDMQVNKTTTTATQRNSLWKFDVNGETGPFAGDASKLFSPTIGSASQVMDLAINRINGRLYMTQSRSVGNEAGLYMLGQDGTKLWDSLAATRVLTGNSASTDFLNNSTGIEAAPDGSYAAITRVDGDIWILPLLADGTPDLANRMLLDAQTPVANGTAARDLAFDAAGNLYFANYVSGTEHLRIFSPGGETLATTSSSGTFTIVTVPEPTALGLLTVVSAGLLLRRKKRREGVRFLMDEQRPTSPRRE